ncbi:MAG: beta-ureidopropionase / N-carbamoyl-L-amino-acid hydrolase [Thermoleophilales bacterium]|nr:beta-ureidopropionase / N-carbamoyl-L-amino-acid hydrolase [Thermoleophilales bacterium]
MITGDALARRLADLIPIGLGEDGTNRLAWTDEDAATARWFAAQAASLALEVHRDPAGNLWASPPGEGPWWGVGSHLDSVRDGGRYDGALGVAAAFEVAAHSRVPVAVVSFADEEGARWNTPTFGSRALVGRLDLDDVLARRDDDGVLLADAMRAAGVDPDGVGDAPSWLGRLRGFLELHIDQSTDVAAAGAPAGVVSGLASRLRLQVDLSGQADHAGTTPRADRRDALATAARLIVAGDDLAADVPEFVMTASRILVSPNALTTVPSHVRLWLDARAPAPADVDGWHERLETVARDLARRSGVAIDIAIASRSAGVEFDAGVRNALRASKGSVPEVMCFAGHDAGVIGERLPAGMVLVRNPRGVSHSPEEDVSLDDAAAGANMILTALERLA